MAKSKVTYESRVDTAIQKIMAKPYRCLNVIGQFLTKEIKAATPRSKKKRMIKKADGTEIEVSPGRLRKSIGYWARKKEKDLQIGSKAFYAPFIEQGDSSVRGKKEPFIEPTVMKNIDTIKELVSATYKELEKEDGGED
jgi:superfamily II DNA or RNA helicase